MGKYQLRFVICTLCIILQCSISEQGRITTNNDNAVEIRIPGSVSNTNSAPQNQQFGSTSYYTQLCQYYPYLCNSCNGFLCNNRCSNPVPPKSNSGRIKIIIDSRTPPKPAPDSAKPAPTDGDTPPSNKPMPNSPATTPDGEQQATPVTPDSNTPPEDTPPTTAVNSQATNTATVTN